MLNQDDFEAIQVRSRMFEKIFWIYCLKIFFIHTDTTDKSKRLELHVGRQM